MIRSLIALLLVLTGWLAALWFLVVPDFSRWHLPQLAAIHLGPPVIAWGVWTIWRRNRQNSAEKAAAERASLAEKARQEKSDTAHQKHAAKLLHLRYGCDCRALAMTQVSQAPGGDEAVVPEGEAISLSTVGSDAYGEDSDEQNLLEHLQPGIEEALQSIYLSCPAAIAFPIYIAPPADLAGEEVIACLRQIRAELATAFDAPHRTESELGRILFLPSTDSVAGSIIGIFETNPELPAALILAFDSPAWRASKQESGDDGEGEATKTQRQRLGQPGQGIFALFMTNTQLPEMLRTAPVYHGRDDALTPFWEKTLTASGSAAYLDILSEIERNSLQSAPVLARIHRAASIQFPDKPPRSMELSRFIEDLLKQAQIHAALTELSPESPPELPTEPPPESSDSPAPDYHWLIHNAGGVDHSGLRLSALGVALFRRGIELDLIAEASNITVRIGDLGQARGAAMLALTVARAASGEGAALCAEFTGTASIHGNQGMSLSFAVAPQGDA